MNGSRTKLLRWRCRLASPLAFTHITVQAVEMEDTLERWCSAPSFLIQNTEGVSWDCVIVSVLGRRGGKHMVAGARCNLALRLERPVGQNLLA